MWVLEQNWERENRDGEFEPPPCRTVLTTDADQLRVALKVKAAGQPYCYQLRSDDGDYLAVWLGGPWAVLSRTWQTAQKRFYRAARHKGPRAEHEVNFDNGREGCLAGPDELVPAAEAIDAMVYFFEHHALSPKLNWVGWDNQIPAIPAVG